MAKKTLNIGMVGYGFMGRAHSNAYRKVGNFFDLDYQPVLKAVAARSRGKAEEFATMACFLASDAGSYITGTAINIDGGRSPVV